MGRGRCAATFDFHTAAHGDRDAVAVFEPRARDGFERPRRRPARGHDAVNATRLGGREGREADQGSFHSFYNVMPSIDEIFGSLVIYAVGEGPVNQRTSEMRERQA